MKTIKAKAFIKKYFNLKSITVWCGIAEIAVNGVREAGIEISGRVDKVIFAIGIIAMRAAIELKKSKEEK